MKKKLILSFIAGVVTILIIGIATFQHSRSWQNAFFIDPIYKLDTTQKTVALTFDDGPSETRTPPLLDLLEKHDVKATFFMLGENIEKHPDIAKKVYEKGHLIGNHSYNHPRLIFKTPSFIREQISTTDQLIMATGQKEIQYFRPPYSSKYIVLPLVLQSMDKKLVTGTYDPPSEYVSPYNAEKVADEVISNTEPGSIIYLHDGKNSDQEAFIQSIELIISGLKDKGYTFVRLDEANNTKKFELNAQETECHRLALANIEPRLESATTPWNKNLILSDIQCEYYASTQEYPYQFEAHGTVSDQLPDYTSSLYQELQLKEISFYGFYNLEYSEECMTIGEEEVYSEIWQGGEEGARITEGTARCRWLSEEEATDSILNS